MIYLISGSSRSGKTIIAKKVMKQFQIPYLSLDWLVMGFTKGIPQYGIHDKLWPNEIAEKLWDFLKAMLESMIWSEVDHVIEGEAILPELVNELLIKHPDSLRICFVGYSNVDVKEKVKDVYRYSYQNDWLSKESRDYVENHISNMVEYSKMIKKSCEKYNIQYFDTSRNFVQVLDNTIKFLIENDSKAL